MSQIPEGWYSDPDNPALQRYWDGADWTQHTAPAAPTTAGSPPPPPATAAALPAVPPVAPLPVGGLGLAVDVYSESVDLNQVLTPEERELYKQHTLRSFPTWLAVILSIVTLGIFSTIFYLLKHEQLPRVKHDDPPAGKAIGFSFIPFFNLYWMFVAWPRLADRINFQYRLRGQPSPITRSMVIALLILILVGWVIVVGLIAAFVLWIILIVQTQGAVNKLADGRI